MNGAKVEDTTVESSSEFTPTVITILPEPTQPKPTVARNRKLKLPMLRRNREYNLKDNNNNDEILFANIYH
jgi:hypothetical protein